MSIAKQIVVSYFLFLILGCFSVVVAQQEIPVGTWRTHYSYLNAQVVKHADELVLCAAENGLFLIDLEDNSRVLLNKTQGLSDQGASAIAHDASSQTWIIGYRNGNIDFVQNNRITNLPVILNASIEGDKTIRHIYINGQLAYLSTPFGVVVVDLRTRVVRANYRNIGPQGSALSAFGTAIFRDSLYIAGNQGLLVAPLQQNLNLQDFDSWSVVSSSAGLPTTQMRHVVVWQNTLWAGTGQGLIYRYADTWQFSQNQTGSPIRSVDISVDRMLITTDRGIFEWLSDGNFKELSLGAPEPSNTIYHRNAYWVADRQKGLLRFRNNASDMLSPRGPVTDQIGKFFPQYGRIYALPGGITDEGMIDSKTPGWSVFELGLWQNFGPFPESDIPISPFNGLSGLAYDELTGTYFVSSINSGIMSIDRNGQATFINDRTPGSTLTRSAQFGDSIIISDLHMAISGKLLIANYGVNRSLHIWDGSGGWTSHSFAGNAARFPREILSMPNGDIWIRLDPQAGGGVIVYNPNTGISRTLGTARGNGGLPSQLVSSMAYDKKGLMWIGTDRGLVYFSEPLNVLRTNGSGSFSEVNAIVPIFDSGLLLREEQITALTVDPGNQKWVGTRNGVWLFDGLVQNLVQHFTRLNSPLPSDLIRKIVVEERSGEVFISTVQGVVSFRGNSTRPEHTHNNIRIFPNPVDPNFIGEVSISGLVNNAIVKITDTNGNIVYETRSLGGTATWAVSDFQGRRATTGVYLIYSSEPTGTDTYVGKIAIIK
ncbi:MAG: hypothetical protein JJU28_23070 [Cyclobacteriaceae bacterium]|nr:hypothetical protein [Cyclobacteriaceae bacterium]